MADPRFQFLDSLSPDELAAFKQPALALDLGDRGAFPSAPDRPATRIVAEGDSWFSYPLRTDVVDCLRRGFHYEVIDFSAPGDTLENMILGTGITREFQPTRPPLEDVLAALARTRSPVLLFSGGGNDVARDGFESYLNGAESGLPVIREAYLRYMFETVFPRYYETLLDRVHAVSPRTVVITHGYARTVPTGLGYRVLGGTWAGPWLLPALARKRVSPAAERRRVVFAVIDAFNQALAAFAKAHPGRFVHVDLRPHLDPDSDWDNELHLTSSGFATAAQELDRAIRTVMSRRKG